MSESVICLPPRVSLCTCGRRWEERASRRLGRVSPGWWGPSLLPNTTPPQPLPSCIYSRIWLIYSTAVCVKNSLSYKNMKAGAGMGGKTKSRSPPYKCIPLPQGMTSESKQGGYPACSSSPGVGSCSRGLRSMGSRHVGWHRNVHTQCTGVPRLGSEGQCLHKDLVDDGRRGHQVLQLEVEDALQALGAQGSQLRQLA